MLIVNADRAQLLTHLPQGGVVAEVGVFRGAFATEILKRSRPEKLHLIDPWAHDGNPTDQHVVAMQASHDRVQRLFADDTKTGRVEIHRDYSTSAALTFPDHYFDWVYIDAEHDYTSVKTDLETFRDKIKPDGIILGHDFSRRHDRAYFGVITAVREFAIEHAFEILLITNESSPTYLLMRADNEIGMAKLRDDILVSHASLPIEVDVSMFDAFTQVEVPVAKGKLAQMLSFGACPGNSESAHSENLAAHADQRGSQAPVRHHLAQDRTDELIATLRDEVMWLRDQIASKSEADVERLIASGDRPSVGEPGPAAELYLDLMKKCLTRLLFDDESVSPATGQRVRRSAAKRIGGRDWPAEAETMIGLRRLENIEQCVTDVVRRQVPGDLIETGVWRGGATIFMRAILKAYDDRSRTVWVADSFQGLPQPDPERFPADKRVYNFNQDFLAVSVEQVKANFTRYGLLDEQVQFIEGWFRDTLPVAPIEQLAILRLDGDLYESTAIALESLYPRLSIGGYAIIDDYGVSNGACRKAVADFRSRAGVNEPIQDIDGIGVFWRRES